jgi:hypothetical protein
MKTKWLPIIAGALAGGVVSLTTTWLIGWCRRCRLHQKLRICRPEAQYSDETKISVLTVRVHNRHVFPLTDCWAYLSLVYNKDTDILFPPDNRSAHIKPNAPFPLQDDRLCWSVTYPKPQPPKVDIYADESQSLQVLEFNRIANWIGIFSESRGNPYRVFLRGDRVYEGCLKIVSKETKAKEAAIRIDLSDPMFPQKMILM